MSPTSAPAIRSSIVLSIVLACLLAAPGSALPQGIPEVASFWNSGRKQQAISVLSRKAEIEQKGVIHGRVVNEDGSPATSEQRDLISVQSAGSWSVHNFYWADDGSFLFMVPLGPCRVVARGTQYAAGTAVFQVSEGRAVDVGTLTLRPLDHSGRPTAKLRLRLQAAGRADKGGLEVRADALDNRAFVAVTDPDGEATIEIPAVPGRWRVLSVVPGYASIWSFVNIKGPDVVDLGSYEVTPLQHVTIRWRAPRRAKSRRLDKDVDEGRVTMRSYDKEMSPEGPLSRQFSFEKKAIIATDREGGDLDLRQAGDAKPLVEVAPGVFRTSSLEFFPGTMARVNPGRAAMADLGPIDLDALREVPEDGLRAYSDRTGLPVQAGHVYAWRSFDGKRYAAFVVEKVEDVPVP